MKILYNDERYLRDEVKWLLCAGQLIDIHTLKFLADSGAYGGVDHLSMFTYANEDYNIFPGPEGPVTLIIWKISDHDAIDTIVLYSSDMFYRYLRKLCLVTALIHPFQLKRIITCLAKIKHGLKLDQ